MVLEALVHIPHPIECESVRLENHPTSRCLASDDDAPSLPWGIFKQENPLFGPSPAAAEHRTNRREDRKEQPGSWQVFKLDLVTTRGKHAT